MIRYPALAAAAMLAGCAGSPATQTPFDLPQLRTQPASVNRLLPSPSCLSIACIYITHFRMHSVAVFAADANGNVAPIGSITGRRTGLRCPAGIFVSESHVIYVANSCSGYFNSGKVTVYAAGAQGNVEPIQTIEGSRTHFHDPAGVAVDAAGNIYVTNYFGNRVTVFAAGANGNVAPIRAIGGSKTGLYYPSGIALNGSRNLYVTNYNPSPSVTVYDANASGNVAPIRTISGTNTGLMFPDGIALDAFGRIYVANYGGSVTVYTAGALGNVAPIRTISGSDTELGGPTGIALYSANIFIYNISPNSVTVYAATANGDVAPIREIAGSNTEFKHRASFGLAVR